MFNELYSAQRTKPNEEGIVEFSGFTSTSKYPMWDTFAKKGGAVYTLHKVIGYDLSEYNSGEQEVILLSGTKWKVVAESTETIQKGDYEYSWEFEVPHYVIEPLIPLECEEALKIPFSLEKGYLQVTKELPEHGWKIAWELPLVHYSNEWIVTENYPFNGWMVAERL